MRAIFALVLVVGMGLAGFAVYMVKNQFGEQQALIAQSQARAAAATPTIEVYAAKREIAYGEFLTPDDIYVIRYAADYLPEGVFRTEEELFPEGTDVHRVVTYPLFPNEPILNAKVTLPGRDAGITSRLAPNMVAFTINVDATTGVSGFLRPGNHVDVFWTGSVKSGRDNRHITRLIKSGIEIIAVDQSSEVTRLTEVAKTVTVQVTREDAAGLDLGQRTGTLSLSLVGNDVDMTAATEVIEIDQNTLLGIEEEVVAEVVPEAEPEMCERRERRGAELIVQQIPCSE